MKKEDSKAKVYGQNEKIWYLCIPYYFLTSPTMSQLETSMGDKGLLIYMRLLFLATASQGILRLDNEKETFFGRYVDNNTPRSPLSSIVSALGNRYTEQDIAKTLDILERCGAIKVLAEEQLRFRDVYEMGMERQRRVAEKRAQKGRIMFDDDGLEESEEPEEDPAQIEEQQEETEAKPEKKPAPVRHRYGEYNNVLLSDEDMEKLKKEFPTDYQTRIEDLSEYIESKGVKYSNHLATIRAWARRDAKKAQKGQQATQTQAPTRESIKKRLEADGVLSSYAGVDHARWNKVQDKYTDEAKVWAVKIMAENEI